MEILQSDMAPETIPATIAEIGCMYCKSSQLLLGVMNGATGFSRVFKGRG